MRLYNVVLRKIINMEFLVYYMFIFCRVLGDYRFFNRIVILFLLWFCCFGDLVVFIFLLILLKS